MTLQDFCQQITFTMLNPQQALLFKLPTPFLFELANTQTDLLDSKQKLRLHFLNENIQHMSTLAIAFILNQAVKLMDPNLMYLNIGIWNGFSLWAGLLNNPDKQGIGVDNFLFWGGDYGACLLNQKKLGVQNSQIIKSDFIDYLKYQHQQAIGVYFYDGPHDYDHQVLALELAEPFWAENAVIIVDDINLPGPMQSIQDFFEPRPHLYQRIFEVKTASNNHPTFWNGISVWQKCSRSIL